MEWPKGLPKNGSLKFDERIKRFPGPSIPEKGMNKGSWKGLIPVR